MPATVLYHESSKDLRGVLAHTLDKDRLKALHVVSGWRHAAVVCRQFAVLALAAWVGAAWHDRWYAWIPAAIAIGFVVFGFLNLLHEVVHRTVFANRRSPWNRVLGLVYATLGGLSASQFTRWHLDHHDALGTDDRDPKRAYLTPKIVRRWFKALYVTPALFPIYFRAAARASAGYEPALRRRIRLERLVTTVFHLGLAASIWTLADAEYAWKLHLLPVFVVFPFAFTINRLGQHYDVRPEDPAAWGTLMRRSPLFWDRVYLWTNYHLEHHYFPRVPMYRLPALRRELDPFFEKRGIRPRSYAGLLWDWFVRNKTPHTNWAE